MIIGISYLKAGLNCSGKFNVIMIGMETASSSMTVLLSTSFIPETRRYLQSNT